MQTSETKCTQFRLPDKSVIICPGATIILIVPDTDIFQKTTTPRVAFGIMII